MINLYQESYLNENLGLNIFSKYYPRYITSYKSQIKDIKSLKEVFLKEKELHTPYGCCKSNYKLKCFICGKIIERGSIIITLNNINKKYYKNPVHLNCRKNIQNLVDSRTRYIDNEYKKTYYNFKNLWNTIIYYK